MATKTPKTVRPKPEVPFQGRIGRTTNDSKPDFLGASATFGGSIDMPNFQRLADSGLRYNTFHTTAPRR